MGWVDGVPVPVVVSVDYPDGLMVELGTPYVMPASFHGEQPVFLPKQTWSFATLDPEEPDF